MNYLKSFSLLQRQNSSGSTIFVYNVSSKKRDPCIESRGLFDAYIPFSGTNRKESDLPIHRTGNYANILLLFISILCLMLWIKEQTFIICRIVYQSNPTSKYRQLPQHKFAWVYLILYPGCLVFRT